MQNLEKALKKNGRIMTLLITALILLILYAIILSGDIGSAKSKIRLSYREQIADLTTEITDIQDGTAANDEKIAGYQEDIDALNADIAAIEAGTYTGN